MRPTDLEITLSTLTYGGDVLGRLEDGRAVFVPLCLPGERVRIELMEEREHFARGRLLEVLEAAPGRTAPRCRHFGTCGGCHYQHLDYLAQLEAKAEILGDQLARIGHIENAPVAPAISAGTAWNYRNQMQFHLDPKGRLGFVRAMKGPAAEGILPIEECHLPAPAINALWPQLFFDDAPGLERVVVRAGDHDELLLVMYSNSAAAPDLEIGATVSVAHVYGDDVLVQAGEDHIRLSLMGRTFRVSPTSFFQVNQAVAEAVIQHVLDRLPPTPKTLIDVYGGVGLFSAFMAPRCARLIAIEASAPACEDFSANLNEFENVELYEDAAEHVLPVLDVQPDAVVLDPPRTGLERAALDGLVRISPASIIYVSCDPATLARDASRLVHAGYRLDEVVPFDMFPQTYHIESVSVFEK